MTKKKQEPYIYQIGNSTLRMKPMKMRQIREFVNLFSKFDIGDRTDFTFSDITELLFKEKLQEVAVIVFGGEAANVDWDEVEFEEVDRMVNDFFGLNPSLIARLKELAASFVLSRSGLEMPSKSDTDTTL